MNIIEAKKIMTQLCVNNEIPPKGIEAYTTIVEHYENLLNSYNTKPIPWSTKEEQNLIEMYNIGYTPSLMSSQIGRSVRAIERRISYLKNRGVIQ